MILKELQNLYGHYVAERVRQGLTGQAFDDLQIEQIVPYFDLIAEKSYEEYRRRMNVDLPENAPVNSKREYLAILYRRWQEAEEIAKLVLQAEDQVVNGKKQDEKSA